MSQLQSGQTGFFALLVTRCALQMSHPGLGQVVVSKYFISIQPSRSHARDLRCEPNHLEHPDTVPVHVYLVPFQTVPGGTGMRMMIVVPPFTKGQ